MGQWLHYPTPGIPRTADGKPDLTARAPKTPDGKPDLSGIWHRTADRFYNNIAADLKPGDVLPWAEALYQQRKAEFGKDSMEVRCLPYGPAASTTPYPSWMGYSVGQWEDDALVVESAGFTDRAWLDYDGHPHTEGLRMAERFRRRDFGHLDLQITFEDRGAYAKPWTVSAPLELFPDTEMLETVCNENEKDVSHMPGQLPGQQTAEIKVAAEILAKYAGAYEMQEKGKVRSGTQHLVAMSETSFSQSGNVIQFVAAIARQSWN